LAADGVSHPVGRHPCGGQAADHHAQWCGVARQAGEGGRRENQRRKRQRCRSSGRKRQGRRTPIRPLLALRAARVRPIRSGCTSTEAVFVREALPTADHGRHGRPWRHGKIQPGNGRRRLDGDGTQSLGGGAQGASAGLVPQRRRQHGRAQPSSRRHLPVLRHPTGGAPGLVLHDLRE
jgi:hypothetical protein